MHDSSLIFQRRIQCPFQNWEKIVEAPTKPFLSPSSILFGDKLLNNASRFLRKIGRTYDNSSVKVAGPTLILGGGVRWRETFRNVPVSQNSYFVNQKSLWRNSYDAHSFGCSLWAVGKRSSKTRSSHRFRLWNEILNSFSEELFA
ncbi:hypothetical protein DLM75_08685 [Leptospira stimsonii]|uniref:Uncharacterized protein n=1 Tax=Leptospira stimsonii TaxID=2202203 RepID=A0A396Z8H1_9LEPT|nr:hypothetical protein DLM75_08685 [Leptospira stimsonii]